MAKQKPAPTPFIIPGFFIRTTFVRVYKQKLDATDEQAEAEFEALLRFGKIKFSHKFGAADGINIYKYKV